VFWYDFTVDGTRHRGSTETKKQTEARAMEAALIVKAKEQGSAAVRPVRSPILRDFAERFLDWVHGSKLEPNTKRYYQYGWKLLAATSLAGMQLSRITPDQAEAARFFRTIETDGVRNTIECSAQYTNQALRTLKRMLSKAEEWRLIKQVPKVKLSKAYGRDRLIDAKTEQALFDGLAEPIKHRRTRRSREQIPDFLVIAQDTGMRPKEIFCMRIEHIDWENLRIWNPHGKTAKARRFVPMSERMKDVLSARCGLTKEGWVFPSPRSRTGHLNSIAVGFRSLRTRTGVSSKIVPYSARHTYGSFTVEATGNIFAVADSMGHVDVQSMKPYQHHRLDPLRDAIDRRNQGNAARHVLRHVSKTDDSAPGGAPSK
jgi:integrase